MTTSAAIERLSAWASASSARLRRMGKPAWKILTLSLGDDEISWKRTVAVSLEKGGLSIADGQRFLSRIRIRGLRNYPVEEGKYATPENVANSVSLALGVFKARRAEICLGIPKAWSIFHVVELPASVRENLPNVISYELDRLTPFSRDEAYYDFRILEENPEKVRVSVAAVKSDVVDPYLSALRAKGIRVNRVFINLTGMAALLGYSGQGEDSVYLDVDESGFEGALIRNSDLSSVLAGRLEGNDEESIIGKALQEITPFIDHLRKEGKPPRIIFHLRGRLRDRGYPILERLATFPYKVLGDMDLKLEFPGRIVGIPYSALGCALISLRPNAAGMNLLSKGQRREAGRPVAVTAVLGLSVLCAWMIFMVSPIWVEGRRLEELDRQISLRKDEMWKVEAIRKEIDGMSKEIAVINNLKTGSPLVIDIMKELTATLPKNVWLARVRITDKNVDVEGYAAGSASELLPKLEASKYLKKVEFSSPTFRDARMNADRFVIKMEIENPNDEPGKAETADKK
jgi:Tfp pilus assembly protein PilN